MGPKTTTDGALADPLEQVEVAQTSRKVPEGHVRSAQCG
jgi:hypothetical protein